MKKLLSLAAGALLAWGVAGTAIAAQEEMPQEPIKLELTKRPVIYEHAKHATNDCSVCHEAMPQHFPMLTMAGNDTCSVCHHPVDNEPAAYRNCSKCHDVVDPYDKSEKSYFRIFHARDLREGKTSCISCHMDVIQTRPEKRQAMTACAGSSCHPN